MRSRVARCLASKAVVVFGAGLPLSMNEKGKKPGRDGAASLAGGGPGLTADGGAAAGLGVGGGRCRGRFVDRRQTNSKLGESCPRRNRRSAPARHIFLLPYRI